MKQLNLAELTAVNFEDVNKYSNQDYINVFNERNKLAAQVEKLQGIINDIAQGDASLIKITGIKTVSEKEFKDAMES